MKKQAYLLSLIILFATCKKNDKPLSPVLATITTTAASAITPTTVTSGGNITNDGESAITERGVVYDTISNPAVTNNKIESTDRNMAFTVVVTGLSAGTKYYLKAYAINSKGISYGNEISFITGVTLASIVTTNATNITSTTTTSGGNIINTGGASITERGICYNTTGNPTISNNKVTSGSGKGAFISNLTGLTPNTKYFIRAYAINGAGTAYGNEISFITAVTVASITTTNTTSITSTTVTSGGNITNDGGASITERGICYNTTGNPITSNNKVTSGSGKGAFISNLTGLTPNTTYFIRAYAINNAGTAYGNELSFITSPTLATITTTSIANFPGTTANSGGSISNNGGAPITERGVCWNTAPNPTKANNKTTDGTGSGNFGSVLLGLSPNTTYYVRAYATNSAGTAYGNQVSFTSTAGTTFSIGQNFGGGIIFFIDGSGQHCLISSINDQFSGIIWYNGSFVSTGATSSTDGSANTNLIIIFQGRGAYAAQVCKNYNGGGFTDWFLPSIDQLNILYSQKNMVGNFNINVNYWSSTEQDSELAWFQYFLNGNKHLFNKSGTNNIRAIRAF